MQPYEARCHLSYTLHLTSACPTLLSLRPGGLAMQVFRPRPNVLCPGWAPCAGRPICPPPPPPAPACPPRPRSPPPPRPSASAPLPLRREGRSLGGCVCSAHQRSRLIGGSRTGWRAARSALPAADKRRRRAPGRTAACTGSAPPCRRDAPAAHDTPTRDRETAKGGRQILWDSM